MLRFPQGGISTLFVSSKHPPLGWTVGVLPCMALLPCGADRFGRRCISKWRKHDGSWWLRTESGLQATRIVSRRDQTVRACALNICTCAACAFVMGVGGPGCDPVAVGFGSTTEIIGLVQLGESRGLNLESGRHAISGVLPIDLFDHCCVPHPPSDLIADLTEANSGA